MARPASGLAAGLVAERAMVLRQKGRSCRHRVALPGLSVVGTARTVKLSAHAGGPVRRRESRQLQPQGGRRRTVPARGWPSAPGPLASGLFLPATAGGRQVVSACGRLLLSALGGLAPLWQGNPALALPPDIAFSLAGAPGSASAGPSGSSAAGDGASSSPAKDSISPSAASSPAAGLAPQAADSPEAFSPTTTLRLNVNAALGGLGYGGSAVQAGSNTALGEPLLNAVSLNQDSRLTLDTSFTGRDLLRVRLRSGDFGGSGFFSNPPTPLTRLDFAFEEPACTAAGGFCGRDGVSVNRAFLQVPLGSGLRLSFGSRVMQVDMLPVWPSAYTASPILELFQRAGAAGAYSRRVGSGFGLSWQPQGRLKGLSLGYASVAPQGGNGSPADGGLFSGSGGQTNTLQLAYSRSGWNLTATYTRNDARVLLRGTPLASQLAAGGRDGALDSWSLAGYWQPLRGGWVPSISAGWGLDRFAFASLPVAGLTGGSTSSWSVGVVWSDVFGVGNTISLALGAPSRVIALEGPTAVGVEDGGLAFELATQMRVSDSLSLTPALFWLNRPRGAMTGTANLADVLLPAGASGSDASLGVWGALLRATVRF